MIQSFLNWLNYCKKYEVTTVFSAPLSVNLEEKFRLLIERERKTKRAIRGKCFTAFALNFSFLLKPLENKLFFRCLHLLFRLFVYLKLRTEV